jgi:acyl carrier protein
MEQLLTELKREIIEVLNLEDLSPEDLSADAPLFGAADADGLKLDSIDALELIVLLEKNYGIKLKDPVRDKEILQTIRTMAEYIHKNRQK